MKPFAIISILPLSQKSDMSFDINSSWDDSGASVGHKISPTSWTKSSFFSDVLNTNYNYGLDNETLEKFWAGLFEISTVPALLINYKEQNTDCHI